MVAKKDGERMKKDSVEIKVLLLYTSNRIVNLLSNKLNPYG